jgi:hypothetical protein
MKYDCYSVTKLDLDSDPKFNYGSGQASNFGSDRMNNPNLFTYVQNRKIPLPSPQAGYR